jgi:hypothetical protein
LEEVRLTAVPINGYRKLEVLGLGLSGNPTYQASGIIPVCP